MWLTAPENDYRALLDLADPPPALSVAVCLPVYNRVDLLARTVAALVPQSYPSHLLRVVIGDDGSDEDVTEAVAPFADRLDLQVLRRERDGYGAGQARNLAARAAGTDVLVFVDADCLPDRDLVLRHAAWHHHADNLVVIGSRHGLDTSHYSTDELAEGTAPLRADAFGTDAPDRRVLRQTDHRSVLHRRTADQRHGDEAFRSLVSSNFSIRRDRFLEVGGFDETFHRWGGEDVELGWRCHVAGLYTVPEDRAVVFHQLQDDLWDEEGRERSKAENEGVIQNKIPHRFYRRHRKGHIWEVPKVSVVVHPPVAARIAELADQMRAQWHTDWEMVTGGDQPALIRFAETVAADPRFQVLGDEDPLGLVAAARGEYLAVVHGDAALEPRLLMTTLRRLENRRRASAARVAYLVGSRPLRGDDREVVDRAWDTRSTGLPVFHLARRREWMKGLHGAASVGDAFRAVTELSRTIEVKEPLVAVRGAVPGAAMGEPFPAFTNPTTRLVRELAGAGPSPRAIRAVGKYVLRRGTEPDAELPAPSRPGGKPQIRYVGWTGHDNLGDEALLEAISGVLDWGDVRTAKQGDLLLLGGGTLINRGRYLDWLEEQDSPRIERAVFGTGVANPAFWGDREESRRWAEWLGTCAYVGVRGPLSAEILSDWGVRTDVEVVGDAALLFEAEAVRTGGRVVIAPCRTRGELWGESDDDVFLRLADVARDLHNRGHEVHVMAAHPDDDGPCLRIMRAAGLPEMPYLAGYEDLQAAIGLLASSELVVAERLHAAVLAAAVSTPFVGIEYRPKVRDFACSVGMEDRVLRSDDLDGLEDLVRSTLEDAGSIRPEMDRRVGEYRTRLRAASGRLRDVMGA